MGNKIAKQEVPEQFIISSHGDFNRQLDKILKKQSCLIKTVVLPPGVSLDDPRLEAGKVVEEINYKLPVGEKGIWPESHPYEVDVSSKLVPPAFGVPNKSAHYTVYPDGRFAHDKKCGVCLSNYRRACPHI